MLRVALADLRAGAVETNDEIPAGDPRFAAADVEVIAPISVRGRASRAGEGQYYWRVTFETRLRAECRRCLSPVEVPMVESVGVVLSTDPHASESEGFYLLPPRAQDVDLTEPLREEFLLALPHFVECRPDCKGLCPSCGANLNEGPCGCGRASDSRWDALRALADHDSPES